jgi:plastocyanin
MKKLLLFSSILMSSVLMAQTKFTVNVSNGAFTPSSITIDVNDTIEFVNIGGTHWVDGRQSTFPSNPASFDNQSQSGSGWTYQQVFTVAGSYDYRCGIHTTTMFGSITVQLGTAIDENFDLNKLSFYPNPAKNELYFSNFNSINQVNIYSLTGEKIIAAGLEKEKFDVSSLSKGIYFVKIETDKGAVTKKLVIQ